MRENDWPEWQWRTQPSVEPSETDSWWTCRLCGGLDHGKSNPRAPHLSVTQHHRQQQHLMHATLIIIPTPPPISSVNFTTSKHFLKVLSTNTRDKTTPNWLSPWQQLRLQPVCCVLWTGPPWLHQYNWCKYSNLLCNFEPSNQWHQVLSKSNLTDGSYNDGSLVNLSAPLTKKN